MTYNKPRRRNQQNQTLAPKPYKLISFPENPDKQLPLQPPIGQDKYHAVRCHGTLHLTLTVQTALYVSTGVVAMGSDVSDLAPFSIRPDKPDLSTNNQGFQL